MSHSSDKKRCSEDENSSPTMKRRKLHRVDEVCCSCQEDHCPDLLLIGCSNNHTICHMCSRMYLSSHLTMESFPRHFPGKISSMGTFKCPVCQERINGISNIFVFSESTQEDELICCPYREDLEEDTCQESFDLKGLHQHLLQEHNQTVRCPNCSTWLHDSHKSMEDLLLFHILKHCDQVKCQGCDRESNVLSLYMHSLIESEQACDSSMRMLTEFGHELAKCSSLFTEEKESLSRFAGFLTFTVLQYLYRYLQPQGMYQPSLPERLYKVFMVKMFVALHCTESEERLKALRLVAEENDKEQFDGLVLRSVNTVSEVYSRKISQASCLPYFYRILVMSVSSFADTREWFLHYHTWWNELSVHEKYVIDQMMEKYRALIPHHTTLVAYQVPSQFAESSISALQRLVSPQLNMATVGRLP